MGFGNLVIKAGKAAVDAATIAKIGVKITKGFAKMSDDVAAAGNALSKARNAISSTAQTAAAVSKTAGNIAVRKMGQLSQKVIKPTVVRNALRALNVFGAASAITISSTNYVAQQKAKEEMKQQFKQAAISYNRQAQISHLSSLEVALAKMRQQTPDIDNSLMNQHLSQIAMLEQQIDELRKSIESSL